MTTNQDSDGASRKRRSLSEQLNRSPRVIHASWLLGLTVLLSGGGLAGINPASLPLGLLFLIVLFLPMIIAYRRNRLSFPIMFACLFLPAWPWAMYKALSSATRRA